MCEFFSCLVTKSEILWDPGKMIGRTNKMKIQLENAIRALESETEHESWKPKTWNHYAVNIQVNGYGLARNILAADLPNPSGYNSGITQEEAMKMAGRHGTVCIITEIKRRIK